MPAWPGTLPASLFLDGLSVTPRPQTVATTIPGGPPKLRRISSVQNFDVDDVMIMTGTELAAFKTFYFTTLQGGSDTFTFVSPDDGSTVTYQFDGVPTWRPMRAHATTTARLWSVSMPLVIVG